MTDKLAGVHPVLVEKIGRVLQAMAILGHPMMVTDGLRTTAQQQALFAQGRTKPGLIVTYADGITNRSNHQPHADGLGHAVDCTFLLDTDGDGEKDDPVWRDDLPWETYASCARAVGLRVGYDWAGKKRDRPHVELP